MKIDIVCNIRLVDRITSNYLTLFPDTNYLYAVLGYNRSGYFIFISSKKNEGLMTVFLKIESCSGTIEYIYICFKLDGFVDVRELSL